jgi:hypothetical protein
MRVAIVLVVSCQMAPRTSPPDPKQLATELDLVVRNAYGWKTRCAHGGTPHALQISLDGRAVTAVFLMCSDQITVPPPTIHGQLYVTPGKHTIRVRDVQTNVAAELEIVFPVLESMIEGQPPEPMTEEDPPGTAYLLADKLPIWAADDAITIEDPRPFVIGV